IVCTGFMLSHRAGFPTALPKDKQSRYVLTYPYYHGVDPDLSDQHKIREDCLNSREAAEPPADLLHACELNLRANPNDPRSYTALADLLEQRGFTERAATLRRIADRL